MSIFIIFIFHNIYVKCLSGLDGILFVTFFEIFTFSECKKVIQNQAKYGKRVLTKLIFVILL